MHRKNFLKLSLVSGAGLSVGLFNPLTLFARKSYVLDLPSLARYYLAIIAIPTNLPTSNCYCTPTSCAKNNAPENSYYNPSKLWNIILDNRLLYYQNLRDQFSSYQGYTINNASVPFLTESYNPIMKIEGPSLYGLCGALGDYRNSNKSIPPKDLFAPVHEYSNAGYRFDTPACDETVYETRKGTTSISYDKNKSKVRVVAENKPKGILYHSNSYTL